MKIKVVSINGTEYKIPTCIYPYVEKGVRVGWKLKIENKESQFRHGVAGELGSLVSAMKELIKVFGEVIAAAAMKYPSATGVSTPTVSNNKNDKDRGKTYVLVTYAVLTANGGHKAFTKKFIAVSEDIAGVSAIIKEAEVFFSSVCSDYQVAYRKYLEDLRSSTEMQIVSMERRHT